MQIETAHGIRLEYDEFGDAKAPPLLLIMGLATQMIAWPEEFCESLAGAGFRVIRFDNRDIGLSQKFDGHRAPGALRLMMSSRFGLPIRVPYTLADMATDAVGLLDALDLPSAHVVGASMGGMIAQHVAFSHQQRLRTLTSIMSTTGDPSLPGVDFEIIRAFLRRPDSRADRQTIVENSMRLWRLIGSPKFQESDEDLRNRIVASIERSFYPPGFSRQWAAIAADGNRAERLRRIEAPTLVIHGKEDRLVPTAGGIHTAEQVPGARLELFEHMGHDLPRPLLPKFAELITEHARAFEAQAGAA
jgi:pimeloyl-ACP methyl ester carboxylesterase